MHKTSVFHGTLKRWNGECLLTAFSHDYKQKWKARGIICFFNYLLKKKNKIKKSNTQGSNHRSKQSLSYSCRFFLSPLLPLLNSIKCSWQQTGWVLLETKKSIQKKATITSSPLIELITTKRGTGSPFSSPLLSKFPLYCTSTDEMENPKIWITELAMKTLFLELHWGCLSTNDCAAKTRALSSSVHTHSLWSPLINFYVLHSPYSSSKQLITISSTAPVWIFW